QKVYNLYENTLFINLAKGITQADIDVAYDAALNVSESGERYRLMGLLVTYLLIIYRRAGRLNPR
ncbi:hypothetical protein, partial [Listeria grandensis]|uniref:hypothetical protein n=1 Tax=Listeria grandensis TaxID=1494963 RepID=UPI001C89A8F8